MQNNIISSQWIFEFKLNVSSFILWIVLMISSFFFAWFISKLFSIFISILFSRNIRKNESKRNRDHKPVDGITTNRVRAIEIFLFLFFLITFISGTLLFFEYYGFLLCKLIITLFLFGINRSYQSSLIPSFFIRIYMFYYDIVRVGDVLIYNNKHYTIDEIHIFSSRLLLFDSDQEQIDYPIYVVSHSFKIIPNIIIYANDDITFLYGKYKTNFKNNV